MIGAAGMVWLFEGKYNKYNSCNLLIISDIINK